MRRRKAPPHRVPPNNCSQPGQVERYIFCTEIKANIVGFVFQDILFSECCFVLTTPNKERGFFLVFLTPALWHQLLSFPFQALMERKGSLHAWSNKYKGMAEIISSQSLQVVERLTLGRVSIKRPTFGHYQNWSPHPPPYNVIVSLCFNLDKIVLLKCEPDYDLIFSFCTEWNES